MVDLVRRALMQYRDERLKQAMIELRKGDPEQAYPEFNNFQTIQGLLDELSDSLSSQADDHRRAQLFTESKATYANWYNGIKMTVNKDREQFEQNFAYDYGDDEDEPTATDGQAEQNA